MTLVNLFSSILVLFSSTAFGCDQRLYDYTYMLISDKIEHSEMSQKDLDWRYETVIKLRTICNNQLSSWEKGEKNEWNK